MILNFQAPKLKFNNKKSLDLHVIKQYISSQTSPRVTWSCSLTKDSTYSFIIVAGLIIIRSSRPEVFCKKGVFRNFAKFTGKHMCQRLFFNKVAVLRPETLLKKSLWHSCFPVNFVKILRTPFLTQQLWRLLLYHADDFW